MQAVSFSSEQLSSLALISSKTRKWLRCLPTISCIVLTKVWRDLNWIVVKLSFADLFHFKHSSVHLNSLNEWLKLWQYFKEI